MRRLRVSLSVQQCSLRTSADSRLLYFEHDIGSAAATSFCTGQIGGTDKAHYLLVHFDVLFALISFVSVVLNMTFPANLQMYADKLTRDGSRFRNSARLWERRMAADDSALLVNIKRDTAKTVLNEKLLARIRPVALYKSGPNRGHRDLSTPAGTFPNGGGKGAGKGKGKSTASKGKGKGKGIPHLHELTLAADELLLPLVDDEEPERIDVSDVHVDSTGYFAAGTNEMADILVRMKDYQNPLAIVVKQASPHSLTTVNQDILEDNHSPTPVRPCGLPTRGWRMRSQLSFSKTSKRTKS